MDSEFDEAPEKELPTDESQVPLDGPEKDSPESDEGSATEKDRVKNAQRKMHEALQRASESEKKIAELSGKLDAFMQMNKSDEPSPKNPFEFLDTPEFVESLYDDPKNTVKAFKEVIGVFGETLRAQEEAFNQRLNDRVKVVDPAYQAVKSKVAELRKNAKLANLPEEYLVEMAKEIAKPAQSDDDGFRGSIPNSGRRPSAKEADAKREEGIKYFMDKFGYNKYDDKD